MTAGQDRRWAQGAVLAARYFKDVVFISIIVVLVGILLLFVSYIIEEQNNHQPNILVFILRDIGILLNSIGLVSILYETLIRRQLLIDYSEELRRIVDPDTKDLGISALFKDRSDRVTRGHQIAGLINSVRKDMRCLGIGLIQFLPEHQALIKRKIKEEGCSFRFLIYRPDAPTANALDQTLGAGDGGLIRTLAPLTFYFSSFLHDLQQSGHAGKCEIRLYDVVPPWGLITIDHDSGKGRTLVEINGIGTTGAECPGFEVNEKREGWYGFFATQFDSIWAGAKPLSPLPQPTTAGAGSIRKNTSYAS
jgi:hypothetical protein